MCITAPKLNQQLNDLMEFCTSALIPVQMIMEELRHVPIPLQMIMEVSGLARFLITEESNPNPLWKVLFLSRFLRHQESEQSPNSFSHLNRNRGSTPISDQCKTLMTFQLTFNPVSDELDQQSWHSTVSSLLAQYSFTHLILSRNRTQ